MNMLIAYLLGIVSALLPDHIKRTTIQDQTTKQPEKPDPPDECRGVSAEIHLSKEEANHYYRSQNQSHSLQWKMFWVNFLTLLAVATYTYFTCRIMRETKKTSEAAIRQLEMTERPWIKDTLVSASEMKWQNGVSPSWAVNIEATNTGHSVATGLYPQVRLIAVQGDFIDYPRREAKKVCDDADRRFDNIRNDPTAWGTSVFPDDPRTFPGHNVTIPESEIKDKAFDGGANLGKSILPILIGCIAYHYPSSDNPHHTWFVYRLTHVEDETLPEPTRAYFGIGKNIPKEKVLLTKIGQFAD